ncbi:MAG: hypothetical protein HY644_13680 [Acidobacteria bacterium]|nr:hypothetical protein [Acidobacteriota bacterium]
MDPAAAGLSPKEARLFRFAIQTYGDPHSVTAEKIVALRNDGVTDQEIVEILEVMNLGSSFNYFCDALDIHADPFLNYGTEDTSRALESPEVGVAKGTANFPTVADANFATEVLQSDRPTIVDFWTSHCEICRRLEFMLEKFDQSMSGRIKIVRINALDNPEVTGRYDVKAVPTLLVFQDGELKGRQTGFQLPHELRAWILPILGGESTGDSAKENTSMKLVNTPAAPRPPGPFSHATVVGDTVYTSGMGGLDPTTGQVVSDDIQQQTRQAMANTEAILKAAGCRIEDVVKVVIYLTDMADYALVNAVYEDCMRGHRPARTCVAVSALPLRERMKLDTVATRKASS